MSTPARLAAGWFGEPASGYGRSDALAARLGNADERWAQVVRRAGIAIE